MDYILSVLDSLYPCRTPVKETDALSPLHPVIPGESVLFLGEIRAGVISLSNYRYDYIHTCSPDFIHFKIYEQNRLNLSHKSFTEANLSCG